MNRQQPQSPETPLKPHRIGIFGRGKKIGELEAQISELKCRISQLTANNENIKPPITSPQTTAKQGNKPTTTEDILRQIVQSAPPLTFGGGGGIKTPPHRPKTLSEASELTQKYLENKKGDYLK